ncbi:Septin-domain-containing protein [Pisolithus marmoratus]|nr:Septin-domain-containing protein [Pisolithus marmoratus]
MCRLSPRVNVIPAIGKADSLTPGEFRGFKKRIVEDIEHYDIPIYDVPYDIEEDDEETIQDNSELRALLPFAIIGSEEALEVEGQSIRARRYPWGISKINNPERSNSLQLSFHLSYAGSSSSMNLTATGSMNVLSIMYEYGGDSALCFCLRVLSLL